MPTLRAVGDIRFVDLENIGEYAEQRLALAASRPPEQLIRCDFRLPFLNVRGLFSNAVLARLCQGALETRPAGQHVEKELEIHITSAADGVDPKPAVWRETSFSPGIFERVITGHRLRGYYHHDYRFWQFYNPAEGLGVQSMAAPDAFPPWESSSPLRAFLHWAYDALGMRLAHAATLGIDGRGVLLAGSGGSGKSGTTLAGIMHGMTSVGDDYVLVDRGPVRRAHAVFSKMKQDLAGLKRLRLSPFGLGGGRLNWQDKLEFYPTALRDDAMTDQLEIVAILLPKIAHAQRTTIRPARAAEAMLALAPSGLFQMPGCAASGVRFFAQLVRETPAFEMHLSENPAEITDALRNFIQTKGLAHAA